MGLLRLYLFHIIVSYQKFIPNEVLNIFLWGNLTIKLKDI